MPVTEINPPVARRSRPLRDGRASTFRFASRLFCLAAVLSIAGCGGRPFNVKARVDPPPTGGTAARAESGGVSIQAEALRDEDYLNDTFDANLILAGILPVRLKATNQSREPVDLSKARFEVKTPGGRAYKSAEAKKAFKRLISYYGISTYSKAGYKESQETFGDYALDLSKPLGGGESREGLVFFIIPNAEAQSSGLRMIASRLDRKGAAVELELN